MTTETTIPRRRAVCLQHVRTGRIITAPSVAAFARKAKLGVYGKCQFDNVLKGHRFHVRGWGLPQRLNQWLDVQDAWGNRWTGRANDLRCHLSSTAVNKLARGEAIGYVRPTGAPDPTGQKHRPYRFKGYSVRRGQDVYTGRTLREVATKAGTSICTVWFLVHGVRKQTLCGLRLHGVRKEKRAALPRR